MHTGPKAKNFGGNSANVDTNLQLGTPNGFKINKDKAQFWADRTTPS